MFLEVLPHWLSEMELGCLKIFERDFIQLLLNGISDENEEISKVAIETLDKHGKMMKEALVALGEEEPGYSTSKKGVAAEEDSKMDTQ